MTSRSFDVSRHAYAHRGLWSPAGPAENSLPAFIAAGRAGVGVELDVRLTKDGALAVFHDATLTRLCSEDVRLDTLTRAELAERRLPDGSRPPLLAEALAALGGEPVLIELKFDAPGDDLADAAAALLAGFDGLAAIMCFDVRTVERLRARIPDRPVGLLIEPEPYIGQDAVLASVRWAREAGCDYLAPHLTSLATAADAAGGMPLVSWTVGDPALLDLTRQHAAGPIFERFAPELAKRR
ncbi:MAG: glycerophosphodiester phosphodiesterase family protein [Alphaproteobacteria bacterium]|nr:glycerophosphodiester phosphodiesterase family protein [Alphaproteobacteria bacterium]